MSRRQPRDPALDAVLSALTAPPTERELDGLAPALSALRAARVDPPATGSQRRRSMLSTLVGAKLGATLAGLAVGLGGAATVAYVAANVAATPDSHASSAASPTGTPTDHPTGRSGAASTATPVGPDATGPAAYGLCTAWKAAAGNGRSMDAVAFRNLATAAGGEAGIAAWCATVTQPGAGHATGKPSTAPTGKPSGVPTGKPSTAPTGKPSTVPTGRPADVPTPSGTVPSHPTGRP